MQFKQNLIPFKQNLIQFKQNFIQFKQNFIRFKNNLSVTTHCWIPKPDFLKWIACKLLIFNYANGLCLRVTANEQGFVQGWH